LADGTQVERPGGVAVLLLALVTIGGFAWYVLTPAERARIRTPLVAAAGV
jgi:hypothetical protein